jgi:hypothetical protein
MSNRSDQGWKPKADGLLVGFGSVVAWRHVPARA